MKYLFYACLSFLPIFGFSQTVNLQQVVGTGLTSPIGVYFAPGDNNTMYIIQQGGRIKLADAGTGVVSGTDFLNITSKVISSGNEQGLLGLAFHPDYANNGYFFVNYTKAGTGATVVARYKRSTGNPLVADVNSEDIVFTVAQPFSNHNGGQLQFGKDGYLYIGMGDGGSANDPNANGQNGMVRLAKMLRVDIDVDSGYAIPADNPFVGDASKLPEIWDIGVRNPWRFSFDQKTADLWIADVGQNVWEEIDFEPANSGGGRNYGWRCYEGNVAFNTSGCASSGFTSPIFVYSHTGGNCSVTGGFVYRGGQYGELYGQYIFTDYCSGKFWLTSPDGLGGWTTNPISTTPTLTNQLTSFGQDGHGEMYVVSRDGNKIYRLTGTVCAPADIYSTSGSLESCTESIELTAPYGPDNTYAWYRNDTLLSETSNVLNTALSGIYRVETENTVSNCGDTANAEVIVSSATPVNVSLPVAALCEDAESVTITVDVVGGTFSGPGVSGNTFSPAGLSGVQQVVYNYTNTDGCTSADTASITVNPLPVVSLTAGNPPGIFCLNDQVPLTGTPAGGTFSGTGVTGQTFVAGSAGVGTYTLSYAYTDANGCADMATAGLTVADCYTGIKEAAGIAFSVFPNPSTGIFTIQAKTEMGQISVYTLEGRLVYNSQVQADVVNVDLSAQAAGVYQLHIQLQNGQKTIQPIILRK